KDLNSDRVITQINGNEITVDAPLTNALDQRFGGGSVFQYTFPGRIHHVGVTNVRGVSDYAGATDENHAWTFIGMSEVENAWVHTIHALHFAVAAVDVRKTSKWVTVENATNLDPISPLTGGFRYSFHVGGQLTLVRDVQTRGGRHDFALDSIVPG